MKKYLFLFVSLLLILSMSSESSAEREEVLGMPIDYFKSLVDLEEVQNQQNLNAFASCVQYKGTRSNTRGGTTTESYDFLNPSFANCMDRNIGVMNTGGGNPAEIHPSRSKITGVVAGWEYDSTIGDYEDAVDFAAICRDDIDKEACAFYYREGKKETPFYGISLMQPPNCPLVINSFPGFEEGGSDFCLCGDDVFRTSEEGLCLEFDESSSISASDLVCDSPSSCEGSNTAGGFYLPYKSEESGGKDDHGWVTSIDYATNPMIPGSTYPWPQEGVPLFTSAWKKRLTVVSDDVSTENFLIIDDLTNRYTLFNSNREPRASMQSISTWIYIDSEIDLSNFDIIYESDDSDSKASMQFELRSLNISLGAPTSSWSFDMISSHGKYKQDTSTIDEGDYLRASIPDSSLQKGWYFLSLKYVVEADNDYRFIVQAKDVSNNIISRNNIPGLVINQDGPLAFDIETSDSKEDAKYRCESNPYLAGIWFDGDWEEVNEKSSQRCCNAQNYGLISPEGVCGQSGWGSQDSVCLAPDGTPVEGTHYSQGAAACCGFDGEDQDGQGGFCSLSVEINDVNELCSEYEASNMCSYYAPSFCTLDVINGGCRGIVQPCNSLNEDTCISEEYQEICEWELSDSTFVSDGGNVGSIETAASNDYLCTVTRDPDFEGMPNLFYSSNIVAPYVDNSQFVWRDADYDAFKIIDAGDGEFRVRHAVSNTDEWFMCDATDDYSLSESTLGDLDILEKGESLDFSMCSNLLSINPELNILNCDHPTSAVCKKQVEESDDEYQGYCMYNASIDESMPNNPYNSCTESCEILDENGVFVSPNEGDFNQEPSDDSSSQSTLTVPNFCWNPVFDDFPECSPGGSDSEQDLPVLEDTCEDNNMMPIDEDQRSQCTGAVAQDEEGNYCCGGSLLNRNEITLDMGDEFICHKRANNNLIRQCGVSMSSWNLDDNPLNDYETLYPTGLAAGAGEPLNSLYVAREDIFSPVAELRVLNSGSSTGDINFGLHKFGNAKELVFFYRQLNEGNIELILSNGETFMMSNESIYEGYKGQGFTNKVVIDISELGNFNSLKFKNVDDNRIDFYINNFYLRGGNDLSDNAFCSSPWSDWHVNLDGPDRDVNSGYFGIDDSERDETELESKKFACNSIPGYGWTGSACCGDDSLGIGNDGYKGEFFVDNEGACIGSGFVPEGQTVAATTGDLLNNLFKDEIADEKIAQKLLYANDELHTCNLDTGDNILSNYVFAFDNSSGSSAKVGDFINTNAESFSIVSRHICLNDGWSRIDDLDRIKLMASALLEVANDDYSLYCGAPDEVANFIPEGFQVNTAQSVCILNNRGHLVDDSSSAVSVMVAISDEIEDRNYTTFLRNQIAGNFGPYNSSAFDDVNCSGEGFLNNCNYNPLTQTDFYVYANELFGLVAFSSDSEFLDIYNNNDGIFSNIAQLWNRLSEWFSSVIFGGNNSVLQDVSFFMDRPFDSFYTSNSGLASVTGYLQNKGSEYDMNIEYINLTTDISNLRDLNPQANNMFIAKNDNVQIILSNNLSSFESWARLTSGLRLAEINENNILTSMDLSCEAPLVEISSECGFAECSPDSECDNQLVSETLVCNESSNNLDSVSTFSVARCQSYQCIEGLGQSEETIVNHTICEYGCQQNENENDICVQYTDAICGFGNGIIDAGYVDPDGSLDDGITDDLCGSGILNHSSIDPPLNSAVVGEELSWVCEGLAGGANRDCSASVFDYDTGQVEGFDVQVNGDIRIGPDYEGGYNDDNVPACSEFADPLSLEFSWDFYERSESEVEVVNYVVQHDLYGYDQSIEVDADSNSLQLDESDLDMDVIADIPWKFNIRAVTNYGGAGPWSEEVQVVADVALCLVAESGDESGDNEGGGNTGGGDGGDYDEGDDQDSDGSGGESDQFQ